MSRFAASQASEFQSMDWHVAANGNAVVVPDAHLLFSGSFKRIGPDLLIEGNGKRALLQDYFVQETSPALLSPDGARLSAETVRALSGLDSPWQVAQAGGAAAPLEIGTVRTLAGSASVQRGGATQQLATGQPIFQGDVVETAAASSLGIVLRDNTVFSLSAGARMVMNQLVYDPGRSDNALAVSLVQGSFVFITGQVAKTGAVSVTTPVATMGIRGTSPIVKLSATDGSGEFSLAADPGGIIGDYVLTNLATGEVIARVASTDIVVRIQSAAGPFQVAQKSIAELQSDQLLIAPAYQVFLLINQRGDAVSPIQRVDTGKGQAGGGFEYAFAVTNLALLGETELLDNSLLGQLEYLGSSSNLFRDVLRPGLQGAALSVDLDTTSPSVNRSVVFAENAGPLPVSSAVQITTPPGVATLSSATVVLQNQFAGDNLLVGALPPGITVTITFGSIHVNLTGNASVADYIAAIEAIRFINTSDSPSTEVRIIDVTVNATNGETATATTLVTIQPINDAPVNHLPHAQAPSEDGSFVFSAATGNAITVSDVDAGNLPIATTLTVQHGVLSIAHAAIASAGVTVTGNGTGSLIITGAQSAINAALDGLAYQPNANFTGSDAISVATNDNGAFGIPLQPLSSSSTSSQLNVASVNDAPSGADTTVATDRNTSVALTLDNFGFSDPNDSPADGLLAVVITTLPAAGELTLYGYEVYAGQSISAADIAHGALVWTPPEYAAGDALATLTFQVRDDGGTANGGSDIDASPNSIIFDVIATNQAPVITAATIEGTTTAWAREGYLDGIGDPAPASPPAQTAPGVFQITTNQTGDVGAIWQAVDLSQDFSLVTRVNLGTNSEFGYSGNPGADGLTFTIQQQGTQALTELNFDGGGHGGGALGVGGFGEAGLASAFGIWIDTFDNEKSVEANGRSISFYENNSAGQTDLPAGATPFSFAAPLENGAWHNLAIAWNAGTNTLSFTFQRLDTGGGIAEEITRHQVFSPQELGPGGTYYLGFTGATGLFTNNQSVEILSFDGASTSDGTVVAVLNETATVVSAQGQIVFTDPDPGDTPQASYSSATGALITASGVTLTAEQTAEFIQAFSVLADGAWTFNLTSPLYLTGDQTVTAAYTVTVTDDFGATDTTTVTLRVDGSDFAPALDLSGAAPSAVGWLHSTPQDTAAADILDPFRIASGGDEIIGYGIDVPGTQRIDGQLSIAAGAVTGTSLEDPDVANSYVQYNFTTATSLPGDAVIAGFQHTQSASTGSFHYAISISTSGVANGDEQYLTGPLDGAPNPGTVTNVVANAIEPYHLTADTDYQVRIYFFDADAQELHWDDFRLDITDSSLDAGATFFAGGPAVSIAGVAGNAVIADIDSAEMASATIRLTNAQYDDVLMINGHLPGGIVASAYNSSTGVLTLQGAASIADYQQAITLVTFENPSSYVNSGDRIIEVSVSDGVASSEASYSHIAVAGGGHESDARAFTGPLESDAAPSDKTPVQLAVNTFTGLGGAVDLIDFEAAEFAGISTISFRADAPLANPQFAVDILINFDNSEHRIDLTDLFAARGDSVNGDNIGQFVHASAQPDGSVALVIGAAGANSPAAFQVANISGTAAGGSHALSAGDTISIVFDQVQAANVAIHGAAA